MSGYGRPPADRDRELFDSEELAVLPAAETLAGIVLDGDRVRQIGLLHWLGTTAMSELRRVAGEMGWPLKGRSRKDIAGQMLDHYRSPSSLEAAWHRLSESDRNLLGAIAVLTPNYMGKVAERLETVILACPTDWPAPDDPSTAMGRLIDAGYAHVLTVDEGALVIVPNGFTDLAPPPPLLRAVRVSEHRSGPAIDAEAAVWAARFALREETRSTKRSFERDSAFGSPLEWPEDEDAWGISIGGSNPEQDEVYAVLPDLPSPFPDGLRERVREETGVAEVGAARFYLTLALVLEQTRRALASTEEPADSVDEVLGMARLLGAWVASGFLSFDELALTRERGATFRIMQSLARWHHPDNYGSLLARWRAVTTDFLDVLLPASDNEEGWVEAQDFLTLLGDMAPYAFVKPLHHAMTILYEEDHGAVLPDGGPEDRRRIAEAWKVMWQGPMRWLGLVETAFDADGALQALRLTPAGAAFCGRSQWVMWGPHAETPTPGAGEDALRWEDDLGLSLSVGRAGGLRALLSRWAELEGTVEGRTRYRISARRARSAFEAGHTPADLRSALELHGQTLPAAHGEALDRWFARRGLLHRYDDLAVVELASPLLQRELLADARTAQLILHPIGERALAVQASKVGPLLERLEQRGYRPMVIGDDA